ARVGVNPSGRVGLESPDLRRPLKSVKSVKSVDDLPVCAGVLCTCEGTTRAKTRRVLDLVLCAERAIRPPALGKNPQILRPVAGRRREAVFVACSTQCFSRYPLDRALRIIGELEFGKVDVAIHEEGPHLKPSEVVKDVAFAAQKIRIGPSLTPAAFDLQIEASSDADYDQQLRAICRLARMSTVTLLT